MTQPPEQQPQQWWQPQDPQAATGPHSGQWQQAPDGPQQTGSYTGQWQQNPAAQPQTGPYGGPWQQQQQQPQQQAPQQQGQFGGGFQPTQYGGLGAFEEVLVPKKERSKKPLVFGGIGVAVLAAAGVTAWLLGAFAGDTLDQKSLQDGVSKVLTENYGEHDIKNASCPSGQAVKNGTTFDCKVDVSGQQKTVTVRVLNEKPEYEVGAPH
ncbi:protein of unknown function [Amycolatopsis xylanica]|uniref:DUF4333 domain-containing protein n=1 Tax=Amycolatopsis xylanica TaxID=589385 RepID=A0A1H3LKI7_9PSEU|nr:DUF4333 domain-containing protein [Amycolatopsis xylanica]SDY64893.1 protein of unknown function [Amycolatopsis xylanica]